MMNARRQWLFAVPLFVGLAGCIVHDESTTLTINSDGSGDLIVFRSNIRSTQTGNRAALDLAEYRESFNAQTQDMFERIRESNAQLEMALWVREEIPMAHVIRASIPDLAALEALSTFEDPGGAIRITPKFEVTGPHRRFALELVVGPDHIPPPGDADDCAQWKASRASGIYDFRVAIPAGTITDARGFTIARDRQSALFDADEINSLLHAGDGDTELFLKWEVSD